MSLGGIALAIGELVDTSIVMVDNAYRRLSEPRGDAGPVPPEEQPREVIRAAMQVGRALFFSLAVIIVSFIPVFLLEAQEGRMFRPLAWTKTFAMMFATLLAVTLVPALMTIVLRGRRLLDIRTGHMQPLTELVPGALWAPQASPDGRWLYVWTLGPNAFQLYVAPSHDLRTGTVIYTTSDPRDMIDWESERDIIGIITRATPQRLLRFTLPTGDPVPPSD